MIIFRKQIHVKEERLERNKQMCLCVCGKNGREKERNRCGVIYDAEQNT